MIKKFTISFAFIMAGLVAIDSYTNQALTNAGGAPAGNTGSPDDNSTCATSCHTGGPSQSTEVASITSNIPFGQYIPGQTYTITVTMTNQGTNKFGFQVSPQDGSGNLLGTLSSSSSETQLVGSGKYVTHTSTGTIGSGGTKSWTFDWTAPSMGTGTVNFYGAFNFTNGTGSTDGDVIVTETLEVSEGTVSINELAQGAEGFSVYPNPASGPITVAFNTTEDDKLEISLISIEGKLVKQFGTRNFTSGEHKLVIETDELNAGIYFVNIVEGDKSYNRKVFIQ